MAITRAQQYRQMLKDGNFVMQGGVKNYLGKKKTVTVPKDWQSSPDHPTTELAYITKAEKDLLLKKDLHNSLKGKPNRGPSGVMSLNGWGDEGDTSDRSYGGGENYGESNTTGGSGTGGDGSNTDTSGKKDTGTGNYEVTDQKAQDEYNKNRKKREAEDKKNKEADKKAAKEAKEFTKNQKKRDTKRRRAKLNAILSGKSSYTTQKYDALGNPLEDEEGNPIEETFGLGTNNKFGINDKEYQDLISSLPSGSSLNINPLETDAVNEEIRQKAVNDYLTKNIASTDLNDPLTQLMETNDRFSGVNLEAFQNEFNLPKTGLTSLDIALGFAEPFLQKGSKKTKEFFSGTEDGLGNTIFGKPRKSVLEAGKYTIDGMPINPTQFAMLDPALMDDVYGDYMDRRMSNEIDAYGNPTNLNTGGGDQQQDPCLGPNPPAYCAVNNDPTDPATPTRNLGGLAPRFAGSIFDFTGLADGGRAGAMDGGRMMNDDDPTGGIMDLESGRQMYFLGKLVKKASRAVKKIVKSPVGKAALMYFGGNALMNAGGGGLSSFFKSGKGLSLKNLVMGKPLGFKTAGDSVARSGGLLNFMKDNPYLSILGGSSILAGLSGKDEDDGFDIDEYYRTAGLGGQEGIDATRAQGLNALATRFRVADGGRINYAEGSKEPVAKETMPLIDMDGKEMDLREEGGFVPLGRMERADDVPARLSKNEFVFTADAVRNAGEGDIDKGAEVMYNMMKNLESGGEVSEESQGLEGAREMFQTSQRLEEVL